MELGDIELALGALAKKSKGTATGRKLAAMAARLEDASIAIWLQAQVVRVLVRDRVPNLDELARDASVSRDKAAECLLLIDPAAFEADLAEVA